MNNIATRNIKFLVMDVDGTLTDGRIYMGANGEVMKAFDIKDGYGIHDILPAIGIKPIIITGRQSKIVENRCKELGITDYYQGIHNKLETLNKFLAENNSSLHEVAYIGDDLNDLQCMKTILEAGGLTGCPNDAALGIKDFASFVCHKNGGNSAVREFIEYVHSINI